MLKKILCLGILLSGGSQAHELKAHFEATEHTILGDEVTLKGVSKKLKLPNGLSMTFGEIVSMGDFYGIPGEPISEGLSKAERKERFEAVFKTLAQDEAAVDEASKIVEAIHGNRDMIFHEISNGRLPGDIIDEGARERIKKWSCLTGGGCNILTWWNTPGRFIRLAEKNYDHFGDNAILTYLAGHEVALERAQEAGRTKDRVGLEEAYAMNAFASHFLTDRFASGHIRVPRVELPEHVMPKAVGSMLAGMMHNEECSRGLNVHNKRGDRWTAYGDGRYLDSRNQNNRRIMQEALKISNDDIYAAYQTGELPVTHAELDLVPAADEHAPEGHRDVAQMFYWDAERGKLLRRKKLSDPYDYNWTPFWMGVTTLAELQLLGFGH